MEEDQVDAIVTGLVREWLYRKQLFDVLKVFDAETDARSTSLSNTTELIKTLGLGTLVKRNEAAGQPLMSVLEVLTSYFVKAPDRHATLPGSSNAAAVDGVSTSATASAGSAAAKPAPAEPPKAPVRVPVPPIVSAAPPATHSRAQSAGQPAEATAAAAGSAVPASAAVLAAPAAPAAPAAAPAVGLSFWDRINAQKQGTAITHPIVPSVAAGGDAGPAAGPTTAAATANEQAQAPQSADASSAPAVAPVAAPAGSASSAASSAAGGSAPAVMPAAAPSVLVVTAGTAATAAAGAGGGGGGGSFWDRINATKAPAVPSGVPAPIISPVTAAPGADRAACGAAAPEALAAEGQPADAADAGQPSSQPAAELAVDTQPAASAADVAPTTPMPAAAEAPPPVAPSASAASTNAGSAASSGGGGGGGSFWERLQAKAAAAAPASAPAAVAAPAPLPASDISSASATEPAAQPAAVAVADAAISDNSSNVPSAPVAAPVVPATASAPAAPAAPTSGKGSFWDRINAGKTGAPAGTAASAPTVPTVATAAAAAAPVAPPATPPAPAAEDLGSRGKDMDGKVLVAGDKIEARYKGKGTKYYPGKVASVLVGEGGSVTFNLSYDDGDKEDGARPENVRRVGSSKADRVAAAALTPASAPAPAPQATASSSSTGPARPSSSSAMTFTAPDGKSFNDRNEYRRYLFTTFYTIANKHSGVWTKGPGDISGQPFNLEDLSDCTVRLCDWSETVQVDRVSRCRILIGASSESVFLRNCSNCVFTIACKQLRTRDCTNCTIYLYSKTEPVIEASGGMVFSPFNAAYPGLEGHMRSANLDPKRNLWDRIFDFSKDTNTDALPLPHWIKLAVDDGAAAAEEDDNVLGGAGAQGQGPPGGHPSVWRPWTIADLPGGGQPLNPVPRDAVVEMVAKKTGFPGSGAAVGGGHGHGQGAAGHGVANAGGMLSFDIRTGMAAAQAAMDAADEEE